MSSDQSKWAENYKKTLENPPEVGAILTTFSGEDTKLTAELKKGMPPFIFARAYVPELLGEPLGWHLRDAEDNSFHGWRCVLLPRARAEVIQKIGLGELNADETEGTLLVKSLKVIRYSASGNAILCEVHEYCEEKVKVDVTECDETIAKTPDDPAELCEAIALATDGPQQAAEKDILEAEKSAAPSGFATGDVHGHTI